MKTSNRMKWVDEGWRIVSGCGRFAIGPHSTKPGYRGLKDAQTGKEHVCRTVDSARTAARNILSGKFQNVPSTT